MEAGQTSNHCPAVHSNSRASQITSLLDRKLCEDRNYVSLLETQVRNTSFSVWHTLSAQEIFVDYIYKRISAKSKVLGEDAVFRSFQYKCLPPRPTKRTQTDGQAMSIMMCYPPFPEQSA